MSAAAEHAIFEQHAFDFDNAEVIDCERHGLKRRVKPSEALHINAEKHSMNKHNGLELNPNLVQPLPLTPFVVFRKALLTLSLSYLQGTYSFFSSFPNHSPVPYSSFLCHLAVS